ncbi:hypothetical protein DPEC_G00281680 [Dallia pectoralis]|uniref:Uncharacterized protein n=1 Tax=Dallia pectoralis TaxID=75939 RepID=A0ACC2FMZ8_DALPE|nr:hypothetical protein DPEC_G00281680 [Dallia pectoralis]
MREYSGPEAQMAWSICPCQTTSHSCRNLPSQAPACSLVPSLPRLPTSTPPPSRTMRSVRAWSYLDGPLMHMWTPLNHVEPCPPAGHLLYKT